MAEQARVLKVEDLASRAQAQVGGSRVDSVCETMAPAEPTAESEPRHGGRVTEADFASLLRFRSEAEHRDGLPARPNVRGEAGPTVLRLAREAHHVPKTPRGPSATPLGLASTEGLGRASGTAERGDSFL